MGKYSHVVRYYSRASKGIIDRNRAGQESTTTTTAPTHNSLEPCQATLSRISKFMFLRRSNQNLEERIREVEAPSSKNIYWLYEILASTIRYT